MRKLVQSIHQRLLARAFAILLYFERSPYTLRHSPFMARLKQLLASQWLPPGEVEQIQLRKAKRLLHHAYEHVPYYRKIFDAAGFNVATFRDMRQLEELPVLSKQDIQDNFEDLRARNAVPSAYYRNTTGGSTGEPLVFLQDHNYEAWGLADIWRNFMMCGFHPGQRRVFLWGSDYDSRQHVGFRRIFHDLLLENMVWVNTFDLDEQRLHATARLMRRFRPHLLVAYVSSATLFATFVKEQGLTGIQPSAIQTSAEVLTPPQRRLLQEVFSCPVFDRYGCREVGNIAHECEAHAGLHLLAENNYTEFLGRDGRPVAPGDTGLITVTNLNNFAMPFIRYQPGDLGRPSRQRCPCGRGLPLMEMVDGRTTDIIRTPSGKLLHGEFFTHLFYGIEGIRQFQVVQKETTRIGITLVPGPRFDRDRIQNFLTSVIKEHGDPLFTVDFSVRSQIPPTASGKYRFVYSEISPPSQPGDRA